MPGMPKNRIIIALGVIVALMPILGFPRAWESPMQVILGVLIVFLSVWATIDKRLSLKAKAQKRQEHKRREVELKEAKELSPESESESDNEEQE